MASQPINHDLRELTINPASEEQKAGILKHTAEHWGTPEAGFEYYARLNSLVETRDYAANGKLVYWVLVPQDNKDTLDWYSSCRTYRRDALVLHAGTEKPQNAFAYVVGTVITPRIHRGNGYAQRMLSLLHYALAPHIFSEPGIDIGAPPSVLPAAFSTLYSDIGNYYDRCGPSAEEPGWRIISPISTTWKIPEAISMLANNAKPLALGDIKLLNEEEVTALLVSDAPDLTSLPRSPGTTYIAFAPTASPNQHLMTRSLAHPLHQRSHGTYWGAHFPSRNHFITWSYDYKSQTLQITRLKSDSATLPSLLITAFRAGESQKCQTAEAWNVPKELQEEIEISGGTTSRRSGHLPALRWYGPKPAKDVVWIMNEYYAWA